MNRTKLPLQDITDRFDYVISTPMLKRKARAPKGSLADKLKAAARHSSPLPPSSPPYGRYEPLPVVGGLPISSSDRLDEGGALGVEADEPSEPRDFSSEYYYNDENHNPALDADADEDNENEPPPAVLNRNNSDPFGFFAVEKQLKAERAVKPRPPGYRKQAPKAVATHPTPEKRLEMPPTPHKRRKRSASVSSATVNPASTPSTPSPVKPSASSGRKSYIAQLSMDLVGDDEEDEENGPKKKRPRGSGPPVNPEKVARNLQALLPKRPARRAAARRGRGRKAVLSEDEEVEERPKRTTRSRKGKGKAPARGKRTKKVEEEEEIDVDDVDKKLAAERRARLDYFKQLEGYEVPKENVYII